MVDKVLEYEYDENEYTFIIMCKSCKPRVSSILLRNQGTIETKREAAIRSYKVYGTTVLSKLYEDDETV